MKKVVVGFSEQSNRPAFKFRELELPAALVLLRKHIKLAIRSKGYPSIEAFCYANGIPKSGMSRLFNLERDPRFGTLLKIFNALEMDFPSLHSLPNPLPDDWDQL